MRRYPLSAEAARVLLGMQPGVKYTALELAERIERNKKRVGQGLARLYGRKLVWRTGEPFPGYSYELSTAGADVQSLLQATCSPSLRTDAPKRVTYQTDRTSPAVEAIRQAFRGCPVRTHRLMDEDRP